jgi:hypothetical protein
MSRPPTKQDNMKLITRFELASKSTSELHVLYREVFNALVRSERETAERRNCLVSLENVQNEINERKHS